MTSFKNPWYTKAIVDCSKTYMEEASDVGDTTEPPESSGI